MHVEQYRVNWSDLDVNGHLRNTAFLDYATETRLRWFALHGFTARHFAEAGIGPVAVRARLLELMKEMPRVEGFVLL